MKAFFLVVLFAISLHNAIGQYRPFTTGYASLQYTHTLKDLTKGNNPWGVGTGIQCFFNLSRVFRPVAEVTGDLYLANDKVGRSGPGDQLLPTIQSTSRLLAGPSLQATPFLNVAATAGVAFVNSRQLFAFRPSVSLFLNRRQGAAINLAYIHVSDRGYYIKEDFTSYAVAALFKVW